MKSAGGNIIEYVSPTSSYGYGSVAFIRVAARYVSWLTDYKLSEFTIRGYIPCGQMYF
jgi:hypothetical protein